MISFGRRLNIFLPDVTLGDALCLILGWRCLLGQEVVVDLVWVRHILHGNMWRTSFGTLMLQIWSQEGKGKVGLFGWSHRLRTIVFEVADPNWKRILSVFVVCKHPMRFYKLKLSMKSIGNSYNDPNIIFKRRIMEKPGVRRLMVGTFWIVALG